MKHRSWEKTKKKLRDGSIKSDVHDCTCWMYEHIAQMCHMISTSELQMMFLHLIKAIAPSSQTQERIEHNLNWLRYFWGKLILILSMNNILCCRPYLLLAHSTEGLAANNGKTPEPIWISTQHARTHRKINGQNKQKKRWNSVCAFVCHCVCSRLYVCASDKRRMWCWREGVEGGSEM